MARHCHMVLCPVGNRIPLRLKVVCQDRPKLRVKRYRLRRGAVVLLSRRWGGWS